VPSTDTATRTKKKKRAVKSKERTLKYPKKLLGRGRQSEKYTIEKGTEKPKRKKTSRKGGKKEGGQRLPFTPPMIPKKKERGCSYSIQKHPKKGIESSTPKKERKKDLPFPDRRGIRK